MATLAGERMQVGFGARLVAARERRGWSLGDLAQHVQITREYLWKIEHDKRLNIGIEHLTRLCRALNVSADVLLGLDDPII